MRTFTSFAAILLVVVSATTATVFTSPASSHEFSLGTLKIDHPMARPTPPVARNGAVFMEISDKDGAGDKLVSASTPQAARTEIHKTSIVNDVAKMERVDGVAVAAGETVSLEPGGIHVMLMGLKGPLVEGEVFPLTLNFEKAGAITVDVKVEKYHKHGEKDASDDHSGHH